VPARDFILTLDNVNDLLSDCYSIPRALILLREQNVSAEFFDLSTRVAGEILQKFTNYSVRSVLVVKTFEGKSDRFVEMASESTRKAGRALSDNEGFGVFTDEAEAAKWLCGE
jgi:hypothetical protein